MSGELEGGRKRTLREKFTQAHMKTFAAFSMCLMRGIQLSVSLIVKDCIEVQGLLFLPTSLAIILSVFFLSGRNPNKPCQSRSTYTEEDETETAYQMEAYLEAQLEKEEDGGASSD